MAHFNLSTDCRSGRQSDEDSDSARAIWKKSHCPFSFIYPLAPHSIRWSPPAHCFFLWLSGGGGADIFCHMSLTPRFQNRGVKTFSKTLISCGMVFAAKLWTPKRCGIALWQNVSPIGFETEGSNHYVIFYVFAKRCGTMGFIKAHGLGPQHLGRNLPCPLVTISRF